MTSSVVDWRAVSLMVDFFFIVESSSSKAAIWVFFSAASSVSWAPVDTAAWVKVLLVVGAFPGWLMAANSARPSSIIDWGKNACVKASENWSVGDDDELRIRVWKA